jgi:transposase-like protein
MSKSEEIYKRYKESGLSQKEIAKKEGISAGMVSYYMSKARKEVNNGEDSNVFKPIHIIPEGDADCCIRITTSKGVQITIPI